MKKMLDSAGLESLVKLDQSRSIADDRRAELQEYYKKDISELEETYKLYRDKSIRIGSFESSDWDSIVDSYKNEKRVEKTILHFLLSTNRLPAALRLISFFENVFPDPSRRHVVDYGCGGADLGLAFAAFGYKVTLVDFGGEKLDFASWRLRRRGLAHEVFAVGKDKEYPTLSDVDIVLAGEVLEHVRSPVSAIRTLDGSLNANGYFWVSDFPFRPKEIGGDHLVSAAEQRLEALEFLENNYQMIEDVRFLMRRLT